MAVWWAIWLERGEDVAEMPAVGKRSRTNDEPERKCMTWDILIRGGTVIDGSGRPGESADIAIEGGRIARIGPGLAGEAARVIDARSLAATPGFIDIKTHSDFTLPINPK